MSFRVLLLRDGLLFPNSRKERGEAVRNGLHAAPTPSLSCRQPSLGDLLPKLEKGSFTRSPHNGIICLMPLAVSTRFIRRLKQTLAICSNRSASFALAPESVTDLIRVLKNSLCSILTHFQLIKSKLLSLLFVLRIVVRRKRFVVSPDTVSQQSAVSRMIIFVHIVFK